MAHIETVEALESVAGPTPAQMHQKVIDHLDAGARRWIAHAPLMFASIGTPGALRLCVAGGPGGFAQSDARLLTLPRDALDDPDGLSAGAAFGGLFLIPGIGETLRVNGRILTVGAQSVEIAVDEVYGHCAKALIRSELWSAAPRADVADNPAGFVSDCRFLALATISTDGRADLSPKGDPAGAMAWLDGTTLWFADRPGNRRLDSFRNIVERPEAALALIVPGSTTIAIARGRAMLTTDEAIRARFQVRGKTPSIAVRIDTENLRLHTSRALDRAGLWPAPETPDIDPARLFIEHVKLNRAGGMGAALSRAALSVPGMTGLVKKGLAKDYRDNLY